MKTLNINFVDFWPGFNYKTFFLYKFLSAYYNLCICEKPDYLFCSCFGYNHWKYDNCIKIYYTAENLAPDFNIYDYGIGFHYIKLEDRYLRFPLWLIYSWGNLEMMQDKQDLDLSGLCNRKFCNFVYSNSGWANPIRERFYYELSKYKKIDSGGSFLNNIGFHVPDKLKFIKDYKFSIAIENSVSPGYTTEKIIEPMMVNSIPIYYGDPYIGKDFNTKSFIQIHDSSDLSDAVENIIQLDQDNSLYCEMLQEKWFVVDNIKRVYEIELKNFMDNIFGKDKIDAVRIVNYGFVHRYRKEMKRTTPWANTFLVEKGYGLIDRIKKL